MKRTKKKMMMADEQSASSPVCDPEASQGVWYVAESDK
jgi:hypothetical protein